jgi:hypothetical protein
LLPENKFKVETFLKGDSHLQITKPAYSDPNNPDADMIQIHSKTADGIFLFIGYPNKRGLLGKIVIESIYANNVEDAALRAYRALTPALSNISFHLDIPMHFY